MHEPMKPKPVSSRQVRRLLLIGGAVFAVILIAGTANKVMAGRDTAQWTAAQAIPTVTVVSPKPVDKGALTLSGRLQAWAEAPVYARTNGYLKDYKVDIGSPVHAGDVLADIDTPDVDQQLAASRAALQTAEAQRALAEITAKRWDELVKKGAVSSQAADEKRGDLNAKTAMRDQAAADVKRLQTMVGFKVILSPFNGIVTARATDIGALITSGSGAQPLFKVSDTSKLRMYVSIPQNFVTSIHPDSPARFTVPEYPGRTFTAKMSNAAGAVDPLTGAMLIQLAAENPDGVLKPGGYASVSFDLPNATSGVRLPSSALLFRADGMSVGIVGRDNKVTLKPVKIVQDYGAQVAVSGELKAEDRIIDSPSAALATGDEVKVADKNADNAKKPDGGA